MPYRAFTPSMSLIAFALAGLACACVIAFLLRTGLAWRLATDVPNERSLHQRPTPRVGGWGVSPVACIAIALAAPTLWPIAAAALSLAVVSQVDDRRGLPARVRFAAHVAAVCVLLVVYRSALPLWMWGAVGVALVWLVNLYNFMDGADGLAGGMAVFGFGGYAIAAHLGGHPSLELALACASVAGAAAGFLVFNFHPARIFLGDAGSIPLGFLAGALGFWGWWAGVWPVWFPAMVFSPFIADASVTLARRLARGERFWQAHREHYYQRMVRSGLGHRRTALCWYAVMGGGIMLGILGLHLPFDWQWATLVVWLGVLCAIGVAIDLRWRRSRLDSAGSEL